MSSETIEYNLVVSTDLAYKDVTKLETTIVRALSEVSLLTGNKTVEAYSRDIIQMISLLRQAQQEARALIALQAIVEAGTLFTPAGAINAASVAVGAVALGISTATWGQS